MNDNVVVFDVDKTLVFGDLHDIVIRSWLQENARYKIIHKLAKFFYAVALVPPIRRKIEYLFTAFIPAADIDRIIRYLLTDASLANKQLLRRIGKYKVSGANVFLVSAAPEKLIAILARVLLVESISSKTVCGILIRDYLAKKSKAYKSLTTRGMVIRTIYSDSTLDFLDKAKNILIDGHSITTKNYYRRKA
ncbi:haloacid dehalogenase-like hydrolase [Roseateles oligotrophus]|uniref:Haloacid dehalogenase-like hydrolase n=1 Tax=Roseateles oligotrophus TaxID=1769250 RepID=A0ABT2YII7_9BURK|nr:haloacid dehalogenase-like hydrolase [Roseateles oligotrophus]MCV2369879.1 haloacid dehalogenase-like hydrolase [Roseateles oligotrophus]